MKIAILTLQNSNNYGAMFQAYALSTYLRREGHDVFFINYYQDVPTTFDYLCKPFAFVGKVLGKGAFSFKFLRGKRIEARGKAVEQGFLEIFDRFRSQYLNIPAGAVHFADLSAACPEADSFIVGSDQVWAADFVFSSPAYLLAFAPPGARKISYAASFGKAKLERYLQHTFRKEIKTFQAVSVREKSGVAIVDELAGLGAVHVVDPTLLISDYSEILDYSLVPQGEYVFSYRLSQSADLTQWADDAVAAVARDMGLPLYSVSTNARGSADENVRHLQPTPGQLLGLIEKAHFFVTNSFHGTVFAINLRTRFLTLARDAAKDKQNLRLEELLDCADASNNFCAPFLSSDKVLFKLASPQDFDAMHERLRPRRLTSTEFLNNALQ
ncbi:MAG: polysaccharide pyruvyl transferase family protein [Pseudomonadota bacterium]